MHCKLLQDTVSSYCEIVAEAISKAAMRLMMVLMNKKAGGVAVDQLSSWVSQILFPRGHI